MENNQLLWMAWTQAWQISLLIVAVLAATRCFASNRPHLAHVLWLVVLLKCLTPPLLASPSGVFCWLQNCFTKSDESAVINSHAFPAAVSHGGPTAPTTVVVWTDRSAALHEASASRDPDQARGWIWPQVSFWGLTAVVWVVGALANLGVSAWRWSRCWRTIRQADMECREDLVRTVAGLADRLRIRKRIGLLVTSSRIGPAVIGIWKPLILLPAAVVQGRTAKELEPILAHELVHVRRGDLWVGLVQVLSQSLWWFHPLVWLANRFLTRDAERCCDEEVIAELGCSPAQYARSLLDVLELKRTLQPVPAFPGVRPVDITSRRLERIMKLGQGSHKRTPWWCGLVMLLVAAAVIPGAKWTAAKDKQKQHDAQDAKEAEAIEWPAVPAAPSTAISVTKVYRLKDVVDRMMKDLGLIEAEAKESLEQILRSSVRWGTSNSKPKFAWSGRKLVVQASTGAHEKIVNAIQCIQENGTQCQIEIHVFTGPSEAMAKLKIDWKTPAEMSPETKAVDFDSAADQLVRQASAFQTIETSSIMLTAEVGDPDARSVLEQINKNAELSAISHPKIVTILGQPASLQIGGKRPLVVGFDKADDGKYAPRVRAFFSGLAIQVLPLPYKQDQIQLDYQLEQSEIAKVNLLRSREGPNPESDKVQVPTIKTSKITTTYAVKLDRTLLIRGLSPSKDGDETKEILVLLRCSQPKPDNNTNSEIKPNPDPQPQPSGPYSNPAKKTPPEQKRNLPNPNSKSRVEDSLKMKGAFDLSEAPLELVLGILSKRFHIQIDLDHEALRAANKQADQRISVKTTHLTPHLTLAETLQQILDPLDLKFIVVGDRLMVTTKDRSTPVISTRTYYVADLVTPIPIPQHEHTYDFMTGLNNLAGMVKSATGAEHWADAGGIGAGVIEAFPTNFSLVISQTDEVHQKIAHLLTQLRRRFEVQICFETRAISLPENVKESWDVNVDLPDGSPADKLKLGSSTYLNSDLTAKLLKAAEAYRAPVLVPMSKATVFDGQSCVIHLGPEDAGLNLKLQAQSSGGEGGDRRICFLVYTIQTGDKSSPTGSQTRSAIIADRDSLLINVQGLLTPEMFREPANADMPVLSKLPHVGPLFRNNPDSSSLKMHLLITPRILVVKEEEEAVQPRP